MNREEHCWAWRRGWSRSGSSTTLHPNRRKQVGRQAGEGEAEPRGRMRGGRGGNRRTSMLSLDFRDEMVRTHRSAKLKRPRPVSPSAGDLDIAHRWRHGASSEGRWERRRAADAPERAARPRRKRTPDRAASSKLPSRGSGGIGRRNLSGLYFCSGRFSAPAWARRKSLLARWVAAGRALKGTGFGSGAGTPGSRGDPTRGSHSTARETPCRFVANVIPIPRHIGRAPGFPSSAEPYSAVYGRAGCPSGLCSKTIFDQLT